MVDMQEFEIKSEFKESILLTKFLNSLEYAGEKQIIDHYLDTPDSMFFELGVFIRIRNNSKLDIKYNNNLLDVSHLSCDEYSFPLPLSNSNKKYVFDFFSEFTNPIINADDVFTCFGLSSFVLIDKTRKVYKSKNMEIAIDNVSNLGQFIEIEARSSAINRVREVAKKLKLSNLPIGYVELYLRKNNFNLYKKGRYLLESDKE